VTAVQRTEMVLRIVEEINMYILELGNEGRLISMQLNELIKHIERDGILLIRDYCGNGLQYNEVYEHIQKLNSSELLDLDAISRTLGHGGTPLMDTLISPKGYRVLSKVPRIPSNVIDNLIKEFKELSNIIDADIADLDNVEGIGETRATAIRNGLKRIKEQVSLKKEIY
jgi:diadenylate cyclase